MTLHGQEALLRAMLVAQVRRFDASGLNRGSTGNMSVRHGSGYLITPSGMEPEAIGEQDIVEALADGSFRGAWQPSSEWHFHAAVYAERPDAHAVVHTHSTNAVAVACLRQALPAFHYMVAIAGGDSVRCAPYHLFGTKALSSAVIEALQGRKACLLANHGLVAIGKNLLEAAKIAVEIESLCETYLKVLSIGPAHILDTSQMAEVIEKFRSYGQARPVV